MTHRTVKLLICFVIAALVIGASPAFAQKSAKLPAEINNNQMVIMGWVEYVYLQDLNGRLKAKLDTGATTSSMRGEVLKVIEPKTKNGKPSVIFQITDEAGKTTTLQRELIRWVRIKGKSGQRHRRPVVQMQFCIAGHPVSSEVNLAPRTDFIYPILVGRNMLRAANIIVDPSKIFTARARCPENIDTKDD